MKDAYSCDRDEAGLDVSYQRAVRRLRADLRAARARGDRRRVRRRDHGRQPAPTSSWSSTPSGEDILVLCDDVRLRRQPADRRSSRKPDPAPEDAAADRGGRDARHDDDRDARGVPRHRRRADRQGGVLRDRRRPVRRRPSSAATTTSTRRSSATRSRRSAGSGRPRSRRSRRAGMEPGYGSPIGARDAVVVVDELVARSPNLVAGANRRGLARPQRQRRRATSRRTSSPTSRTPARATPARPAARRCNLRNGHRGRQHLQARDEVHRRRSGRRTSARTASATRSSWARTASASGATSPASSRRTTTRRASSGRPRSRPYAAHLVAIGADQGAAVAEVAERLHDARAADAGREILWDDRDESPGVKFTDAELLGMPWILTGQPALAGGRRRRGHRARDRGARDPPIEEVEAFLRGDAASPVRADGPRVAFRAWPRVSSCPTDDLYARLEVPSDATPEAIEIAWRALLRRHHPDVAGPDGVARPPRAINVAHDWLSDPELRVRYDRERGIRTGRRGRAAGWDDLGGPARSTARDPAVRPPCPARSGSGARGIPRPGDAVERRRARPARLRGRDADRVRRLDRTLPVEGAAGRRGDRRGRAQDPPSRVVLAASARPRCGPRRGAGARAGRVPRRAPRRTVPWPRARAPDTGLGRGGRPATLRAGRGRRGALIRRVELLSPAGVRSLAAAGTPEVLDAEPWPADTTPEEDEALRVSSVLAARDVARVVGDRSLDKATLERARQSAARLAHLVVLRSSYPAAEWERLTRPWRALLTDDRRRQPSVQRRR